MSNILDIKFALIGQIKIVIHISLHPEISEKQGLHLERRLGLILNET